MRRAGALVGVPQLRRGPQPRRADPREARPARTGSGGVTAYTPADNVKARRRWSGPGAAQEGQLPCGTNRIRLGPLIRRLAAELAVDVKDKTYRLCPVGDTIGRYLDTVAFGCRENTLLSYEQVLAHFARAHDDLADVQVFCDEPLLLERYVYPVW